ncbi:MAG: HAMP domain-containing histidine kinase [Firmicutes bacterium]|nr:HAMP domain-containing histidine kinase [Bacillota bacterium]
MIKLKSITSKILVSYLVVVICSTTITAFSFKSILYGDLIRRAQAGLSRQAWEISMVLRKDPSDLKISQETLQRRPISVFFASRPIESECVVTDAQGIVVYSSLPETYPVGKKPDDLTARIIVEDRASDPNAPIITTRTHRKGEPLYAWAPIGGPGEFKGVVFTIAQEKGLEAFNQDILLLLLKSLLIAGVIAIPVALLFGRYLTKPLNTLKEYAKAVARRRFDVRVDLKSDDELAELANTFNDMAAQLERYDVSMRRFFQGASHEIKTPLMSIQGYAEGIRDGVFIGEKSEQALEIIGKECQRLKSLVDEMINITKLQSPGETYTLKPIDLRPVLAEVVESLQGYAAEEEVRVSLELPAEIRLIGDQEKLRRLFGNLLVNAIRHARSMVQVKGRVSDRTREISIVVEDDGTGFSQNDLEHAFDYFYRGANGSTGLGLAIARLIVEEHNGSIKVENTSAGGAQAEVTLPLNRL